MDSHELGSEEREREIGCLCSYSDVDKLSHLLTGRWEVVLCIDLSSVIGRGIPFGNAACSTTDRPIYRKISLDKSRTVSLDFEPGDTVCNSEVFECAYPKLMPFPSSTVHMGEEYMT